MPCLVLPRSTVSLAVAAAVFLVSLAIPDGCNSFATPPRVSSRPHLWSVGTAPSSIILTQRFASLQDDARFSTLERKMDAVNANLHFMKAKLAAQVIINDAVNTKLAAQVKTNDAVTTDLHTTKAELAAQVIINDDVNTNLHTTKAELAAQVTINDAVNTKLAVLDDRFVRIDKSFSVRSYAKGMENNILKQLRSNNSSSIKFKFRRIFLFLDKFEGKEAEGMRLWNSCCYSEETDWTFQDVKDLATVVSSMTSRADWFAHNVRPDATNGPEEGLQMYKQDFAELFKKQTVQNAIESWQIVYNFFNSTPRLQANDLEYNKCPNGVTQQIAVAGNWTKTNIAHLNELYLLVDVPTQLRQQEETRRRAALFFVTNENAQSVHFYITQDQKEEMPSSDEPNLSVAFLAPSSNEECAQLNDYLKMMMVAI